MRLHGDIQLGVAMIWVALPLVGIRWATHMRAALLICNGDFV